jgi:hypothetical protein
VSTTCGVARVTHAATFLLPGPRTLHRARNAVITASNRNHVTVVPERHFLKTFWQQRSQPIDSSVVMSEFTGFSKRLDFGKMGLVVETTYLRQ